MLMEKIARLAESINTEKAAAGKMMCVAFHNLTQDGDVRIRTGRGIVYMPDCAQYRDIIENGTRAEKAALCQKFTLNLLDGVHFAECDAYISSDKK